MGGGFPVCDSHEHEVCDGDPEVRVDPWPHDHHHHAGHHHDHNNGLTRRSLLRRGGVAAAGALLLPSVVGRGNGILTGTAHALPTTAFDGLTAYGAAMHVHTSFSEGASSMEAAFAEATRVGLQQVIITEHDWRASAQGYRRKVSFDSLNAEREGSNAAWNWRPVASGTLSAGEGGIVTAPTSPLDPSAVNGALHVRAVSSSAAAASYRYYADTEGARTNSRANLTGQRISVEVMPTDVGENAWLELLLRCSYRPAMNGRPAGYYDVSYRFSTRPAGRAAAGLLGVVYVPVGPGEWNSIELSPIDDFRALWPDVKAEDNSSHDLWLGATSQAQAPAQGYFDFLRFSRDTAGDRPLEVMDDLLEHYRPRFPNLTLDRGLEVSYHAIHSNWFGGEQRMYDYATYGGDRVNAPPRDDFTTAASDLIHSRGGLSSLNHPFGTATGKAFSVTERASLRQRHAKRLIDRAAYHADIIEVGYRKRGNALLEDHLALWDVLSRNGLWMTGNGVTDDHGGRAGSWDSMTNHFATYTWAGSAAMPDMLAALEAGRVYVAEMKSFSGFVDLDVEGVPMGSISVRPDRSTRTLRVVAGGLTGAMHLRVLQGLVDYSGAVDPAMTEIARLSSSSLLNGPVSISVDTTTSSFVRVEVHLTSRKTGVVTNVAFSNPIWLLREQPPVRRPIPALRRSSDSWS